MTASRTDTGSALSFSGRFKFGIDQWAYVPFDVPAGINRIVDSECFRVGRRLRRCCLHCFTIRCFGHHHWYDHFLLPVHVVLECARCLTSCLVMLAAV